MKKLFKTIVVLALPFTLLSPINTTTPTIAATISTENQDVQAYEDMLKNEAINELKTTNASIEDQIDIAYQNMLNKENYIVKLINNLEGNVTTFSNWQYNLKYLNNNYDKINEMPDVNKEYVDSYIEEYTYTLRSLQLPEEKTNDKISIFSSYSRSNAADYALEYIKNYNTSYPDWSSYGGDCANFVSQCLYAGGKSMVGTPGTKKAADNWNNWFSSGSTTNTNNVSSTWRGAAAFRDYWQRNSSGYKNFTSMDSETFDYGYRGDAISLLNSNGAAYHTLFIVGYGNTDFKIAAHTDSYVNSSTPYYYYLSERALGNGFIIYNMY